MTIVPSLKGYISKENQFSFPQQLILDYQLPIAPQLWMVLHETLL